MGIADVTAFLNDLAVRRCVVASTQNQALCALTSLYRKLLGIEVPTLTALERARRPDRLSVVLSRRDVLVQLDGLEPPFQLLAELLYGAGLRLGETISPRQGHRPQSPPDHHPSRKRCRDRAALLPADELRNPRVRSVAIPPERRDARAPTA